LINKENFGSHIFSYWSGHVAWLEKLSIASAIETGHKVTVFTYSDTVNLARDLGCNVADARAVSDDSSLDELRRTRPNHFSDHFRLEGIAAGLGTWFDLDIIFLKLLPDIPYILGWQNDDRIGNSILRFPPNDPCLREYLEFCRKRPMAQYVMPWYPWTRKLTRTIKSTIAPLFRVPPPSPKYGPDALTHFVKTNRLTGWASAPSVYYPLPIDDKAIACADHRGFIDQCITRETVCVHAWRSTYFGMNRGIEPTTAGLPANSRNIGSAPGIWLEDHRSPSDIALATACLTKLTP
jgi:hypothetical protein